MRTLWAGLGLAACLCVATAAQAQSSSSAAIEDASRYRGAIHSAWISAHLQVGGTELTARFLREGEELRFFDPTEETWRADDEALPLAYRLLVAALGAGRVSDAFIALGYRLQVNSSHLVPVPGEHAANHAENHAGALHRIGREAAWIDVEFGTSQPRRYGGRDAQHRWEIVILEYAEQANEWIPGSVDIWIDDQLALRYRTLDLARNQQSLAARLAPPAPPAQRILRLPHLPL